MNNNLLDLFYKLKKFNESFKNEKNKIIAGSNIYKSKFLYFYFFLMSEEFKETPYRNILINYFKKSEDLYPGSSYYTSVKLLDNLLLNNHIIEKVSLESNLENLFNYMKSISNKDSFELTRDILNFSGPDGIINCKPTKNKSILIEKTSKPTYKINIHPEFTNIYFSKVSKTTKNVRLSVFDGFIERESELIPLLEEMKKENIPGVIICRGMSENAIKHLKNILLRNKMFLYPYVSKFENDDPFLFKDIATIAETSAVSGEFLDNIYKDIVGKSKIVKVTLEKDKIVFDKKNEELISEINKQLKDCNHNVKEYLNKRKKRASPNNITVHIPMRMNNLLNELKALIKCYNLCVLRGLVLKNEKIYSKHCEEITDRLSEGLFKTLNNIGLTIKLKKVE